MRETYPNLTRWFLTLINQKEVQAVLGADLKLCEKTAQFDGRRILFIFEIFCFFV